MCHQLQSITTSATCFISTMRRPMEASISPLPPKPKLMTSRASMRESTLVKIMPGRDATCPLTIEVP